MENINALCDRLYRNINNGFPWEFHNSLQPLTERGLCYRRKQQFYCSFCAFNQRSWPRFSLVMVPHDNVSPNCHVPLPPPEILNDLLPSQYEVKEWSTTANWSQKRYEIFVLRRMMRMEHLRRLSLYQVVTRLGQYAPQMEALVAAGLWHLGQVDCIECAFCDYRSHILEVDHIQAHTRNNCCPLVRYERAIVTGAQEPQERGAHVMGRLLTQLATQDYTLERVAAVYTACAPNQPKTLAEFYDAEEIVRGKMQEKCAASSSTDPNNGQPILIDLTGEEERPAIPRDELDCIVCCKQPVACAPASCGHCYFCEDCLPLRGNCYYCREPYTKRSRIFLHVEL